MKEERMFILTMVNEGKISAEEGVNLLNALSKSESKGFDNFARGVKYKAASFAEKAEPKVKQAAAAFKEKSGEVFENIKDKFKDKNAQTEASASEEYDYVDLDINDEKSFTERTSRDSEMARNDDTLVIDEIKEK